jgi:hypothetical protein
VVEINSQIHKVLYLRADPNPEVSSAPLQEGVANTRVSMLCPISAAYTILSFHRAHSLAQGLEGGHSGGMLIHLRLR